MLKRKTLYQKLMDIEAERILQLKREKNELERIIEETNLKIKTLNMKTLVYVELFNLEWLQTSLTHYKQKHTEIVNYLESRF